MARRQRRGPATLNERLMLPSLNIKGLASAGGNIIPSKASAALDIRLVMGMDHEHTARRLTEHVRAQGVFVTTEDRAATCCAPIREWPV